MLPDYAPQEPTLTEENPFSSANAILDEHREPLSAKITLRDVLSLLKTLLALKLLHTGASIFRFNNKPRQNLPDGALDQAIDRKEKKILNIILAMSPSELEGVAMHPPPPPPSAETLPLSGIPSTVATHEGISSLSTMCVSTLPSASSAPTAMLVAQRTRTRSSEDDETRNRKRSETYSSLPPPLSDSIYSSGLRRSLSVSNVPTISSVGRRQGMVVSAAQYTRIVSEKQPELSVVSQPLSIDSLIFGRRRVDRSELEIGERLSHSRSIDSFPGRFPVSDGMEYSSLATVVNHLRVPSIRTSVRPFSDL